MSAPPVTTNYLFPGSAAGTGWSATDAGTLVHALSASDDIKAQHAGPLDPTHYLTCKSFNFASESIPDNAIVTDVELFTEDSTGALLLAGEIPYNGAYLTLDGSTNYSTEKQWVTAQDTSGDGTQSVTWTGLTLTGVQVKSANFGVRIHRGSSTNPPDVGPESGRKIDVVKVRVTYIVPVPAPRGGLRWRQFMDIRHIMEKGGIRSLGGEALPDMTAAVALCSNIPTGTQFALLTVRTAGITIRCDGQNPTAAGSGVDLPITDDIGPHLLPFSSEQLAEIKAIENGGNSTGWIEYLTINRG